MTTGHASMAVGVLAAHVLSKHLLNGDEAAQAVVAWLLFVPPTMDCMLPVEICAAVLVPVFLYFTWYVRLVTALVASAGLFARFAARHWSDPKRAALGAGVHLGAAACALGLSSAAAVWESYAAVTLALARGLSHYLAEPLAAAWVGNAKVEALFFYPWLAVLGTHPALLLVVLAFFAPAPPHTAPWASVAGLLSASLYYASSGAGVLQAAARCSLSFAAACRAPSQGKGPPAWSTCMQTAFPVAALEMVLSLSRRS